MSHPVTMKDIAERVGKSVSAVSKALGGAPDIGPETTAAVRGAAADLGYVPNVAARQLQTRRTDTVGLVLPISDLRLSDPFFSEFLSGLVGRLDTFGLGLHVSTVNGEDPESVYLRHIRGRRVDGFVVVRTRVDDPRVAVLDKWKIPFVSFGRTNADCAHNYVDEDGGAAMEAIVDHLVGLGHTRLVCLAEPPEFTKSHHRVQGFLSGLRKHGLAVSDDSVVVAGHRRVSGHQSASQVLGRPEPPTAIACCNDLIALGAMKAAQEIGLAVGRDVSIAGFDDIELAAHVDPSLTTVRNAAEDSGQMAAEILGRVICGEEVMANQVLVDLDLVVRASTGPVRPSAMQ